MWCLYVCRQWVYTLQSLNLDLWYTDKKENEIFLICKEIQMGLVAKSYMRKGFLIYEEMRKYLTIYEDALESYITLQSIPSEFPYVRRKFDFLFYECMFICYECQYFPTHTVQQNTCWLHAYKRFGRRGTEAFGKIVVIHKGGEKKDEKIFVGGKARGA
jgi:hypothetical protein